MITLFIILILLYFYFEPYVDITNDLIILWYDKGFGNNRVRTYKILWKR